MAQMGSMFQAPQLMDVAAKLEEVPFTVQGLANVQSSAWPCWDLLVTFQQGNHGKPVGQTSKSQGLEHNILGNPI